jgi:hypothetical protein
MVNFADRKAAEHWFAGIEPPERRREVAVALATRAALRVTPLLSVGAPGGSMLVLLSLRAAASAWARAKYPVGTFERDLAVAAELAASAAAEAASSAAGANVYTSARARTPAASAEAASVAAAEAASTYGGADAAIYAARYAVLHASASAVRASVRDAASNEAVAADAAFVDSGDSGAELVGLPLWPNGRTADWAAVNWPILKAALRDADEGWEVWTDWYEARLAGDADHPPDEALEIARATIPDEIWEQGPAVANAEIKRLIAGHPERSGRASAGNLGTPEGPNALPGARTGFAAGGFGAPEEVVADTVMQRPPNLVLNLSIPPIESIPKQDSTGTRFGLDAQGRIDVIRVPPATDDLQRFHYDEMYHKAQQLVGLGQMVGDIAPAVTRMLEALPEHMEDASVDMLWSRGNTLRRRHDAHARAVDNDLGPDLARLDSLVAATLGDFIDSLNVFVIGDPRGLELDRIRLGPQDREAADKIVALAGPIARAVGELESPVTLAAQQTLAGQVSSAIEAPNDINGDQAAQLARRTMGKFCQRIAAHCLCRRHERREIRAKGIPRWPLSSRWNHSFRRIGGGLCLLAGGFVIRRPLRRGAERLRCRGLSKSYSCPDYRFDRKGG